MSARAIKNKPEIFHFGIHDDLLFFLDLANNHQGSLDHAKKVIKALADIKKRTSARIMIKLQFRNLDTFIHPGDMMMEVDNAEDLTKHSRRFRETALSKDQYKKMLSYAKSLNIPIYATPFDEASVDMCVDFDFDVIKVASCSAYDWPLLRKIASTGKPVIISLGGMKPNEIDDVVDYFTESGSPFALMHCVSTYPTDINDFRLDIIPWLKKRYPDVPVGYSGHEQPDEHDIGQMCIAKGATMLERHVGLATETITLNKYSVGPKEAEGWIIAAQRAATACANGQPWRPIEAEVASLESLKRGMWAKRTIKAGETVSADDVYLAMPCLHGQYHAGKYYEVIDMYTPMEDIYPHMPIGPDLPAKLPKKIVAASIMGRLKEMLDNAKIKVGADAEVELSHQYGFDRFYEIGAVIIDIVNREYCKKLIIQFPGQDHPSHKHIKKEETFQVLSGELDFVLDGKPATLKAGEKQVVKREQFHSFATKTGVIFEEVSTEHIKGDSVYEDTSIPSDPVTRKTKIRMKL